MIGNYPIMLDGALWGELSVTGKGSLLVFEASCRMREGVLRLSVYGEGREGYLGVLMPENGRLCLRRAMSRTMLRNFPGEIDHVGLSGEKPEETCPAPVDEAGVAEGGEKKDEAALCWYSSPDGVLVSFDGERSLLALPLGDERIPAEPKGRQKNIEGKEYIVYITIDGRIVE